MWRLIINMIDQYRRNQKPMIHRTILHDELVDKILFHLRYV